MMAYTFMLYSVLTFWGWTEHTVGVAPDQRRVWQHTSGITLGQ